ncbi:ATP-dependent DNA helicase [Fructilactobacillus myrtifloralis]|uniref:ATP-dependent DNA helicase n=1 Tax=Fructilactobacillus myrtifloralis TaxID=2940301 RepID=A0ABY5BS37_9LACO|nr:ATP-dependent DNA helicase [Fructilactobacillus myrtifloralis]USS85731.1 ATP-dependent DNA helicase [Fructilactobacillus myrtifloralis]
MQKVGVRELVGFILRSGDLNSALSSFNTPQAGTRIHQRLQRKRSQSYQAEYALQTEVECAGEPLLIHGRADGAILHETSAELEEIKSSDVEFNQLPANQLTLYWGQVKLYAALLMREQPQLTQVTMKLTYVQTPDEIITQTEQTIERDAALDFLTSIVQEYAEWRKLQQQLASERLQSAQTLTFPFPAYRAGQRELAAAVYKSAVRGKQLLAEAPTGTGKTISTLFPAIKAFATTPLERIFYLTAKQSTRRVAEAALDQLRQHGLRVKSITLTAKEQIQFPEEQTLTPEENPYFLGYYDRLKPALKAILTEQRHLTPDLIQTYARKYILDPFEFSLDVSLFCDVIIGDYNYLFDPVVRLQRFFAATNDRQFFLVDEAHNLVDRAREMYSTSLSAVDLENTLALIPENKPNHAVRLKFKNLRRHFRRLQTALDAGELQSDNVDLDDGFTNAVTQLTTALRKWLPQQPAGPKLDPILQFFFACTTYLKITELFGSNFRFRLLQQDHHVTVRLFCLDAAPFISEQLDAGRGAVLFSATLSPLDYYQQVLGDNPETLKYQLPSPFPINSQTILIATYINTTYNQRTNSLAKIIASIHELVTSRPGNYLIFAPSHAYLEQIYAAYRQQFPTQPVTVQTAAMTTDERDQFLAAFQQPTTKPVVGFALLGGLFSEGIDLVGDKLIGVAIVGVGLPGLNPETNLIQAYYEARNGQGFAFAYQLPGLNHVFQAAGRVVRSMQDHGVVLLLDQRFAQARYRTWFPATWNHYRLVHNLSELQQQLQAFWHQHHDL